MTLIKQIILGLDPGFGRMGYGIIIQDGRDWQAVNYGCVETSADKNFCERLLEIKKELGEIIKKYKPTRVAVEDLFFFKNVKTAVKVGQARGVMLLVCAEAGLAVDEFTPLQIKQAITGYGRAEKGQMQKMVQTVLGLKNKIKSDDAADALAAALCAGQSLWMSELK